MFLLCTFILGGVLKPKLRCVIFLTDIFLLQQKEFLERHLALYWLKKCNFQKQYISRYKSVALTNGTSRDALFLKRGVQS